jgi:16S rRNA (uracil1498-N3)-methyltransferase
MPRPPRFFISPNQISGPDITITGEDVRHIATVLRMKTGEDLLLCDGEGAEYAVKITRLGRTEIKTQITGSSRDVGQPRITLDRACRVVTRWT